MRELHRPRSSVRHWRSFLASAGVAVLAATSVPAATENTAPWPQHVLRTDRFWLLNLPNRQRVDASGLIRFPDGKTWIVNDQSPAIYQLQFHDDTNAVDLVRVTNVLSADQIAGLPKGRGEHLDCEGLALDAQGRVYISEESRRWILRWDPAKTALEVLPIDWTPVKSFFSPADPNASFEGVAVSADRLYVANERQRGRIIVLDLATLKILNHFAVSPFKGLKDDPHYSDLCWAENALWALLREERKVLKIDPQEKRVLAEYDYSALERAPETAYGLIYNPGFMEGLAVDDQYFWLLVDNNGIRRQSAPGDTRPTLYRCKRPDR